MKILITGGVGFIGTNTAIYFAKKKHQVVVVDNFSRPGVEINEKFIKQNYPQIKIIKSNILQIKNYQNFLKKANVVIHLAGQTAVTTSVRDPISDFKNNIEDSFYLLEFLRKENAQTTIIYSSTNKVYGNLSSHKLQVNKKKQRYVDICHRDGIDETENLNFISPYACSKGATDLYFLDYGRTFGLKTVVFRQSCIYGKHQIGVEDQGWIAHFALQALTKKPITIFGDGLQVRDLLYVDDLIEAYSLAIEKINKVKGEVFNIGGGIKNSFSLLNVIEILEKKLSTKIKLFFKKERLGDQKYFVSNNKKIRQYLNWKPKTNFSLGLKRLINWQKKYLLK